MGPGTRREVRFGIFELDVQTAELRKNGRRIRLQEQPFQVLRLLLEHPGEVVTRDEIRNKLWPNGTVVEFDHSINAAVRRLRSTLRDSAETPRYIETLARRGYRFIGELEQPAEEAAGLAAAAAPLTVVLGSDLERSESRRAVSGGLRFRSPEVLVPFLLAALILGSFASVWYYRHVSAERWARNIALPEAVRLVSAGRDASAFPLIYRALQILPRDPILNRLRLETSYPIPIHTVPPGASVYVKPYDSPTSAWVYLGHSPIESCLLPAGYFRWRITKPGYRTLENAAGLQAPSIEFVLDRDGAVPPDMVHVPGGNFTWSGLSPVHLDDYWMDKYEVTNRQFKEFIDKGGYQEQQYWREEFVRDDRVLSWKEAVAEFRDATGRPGPSIWEVGDYPRGQDAFPVGGVSWYEAAAYAKFANKQIPTVYHWYRAASQGIYSDILHFSNFDQSGPVGVGRLSGIGQFGTYDMAGNVKEWCWNQLRNRRYILGGGWNEIRSRFAIPDALSPFDRSPANGFRCVKYQESTLREQLMAPVERPLRDYRIEKPVSEAVFRILQGLYSYDRTELEPKTESVDETSPYWRAERITFNAAYDRQRVIAWLYLPRNAKPPYQTVVNFPSGIARLMTTIDLAEIRSVEFLIKSGRAVLLPIYQGTFERRMTRPGGMSSARDVKIQQCKDLQRSVDYLESRTDIAHDRLGFYGVSGGAMMGEIALAIESRIKSAVLAEAGLSTEAKPPEIDEINFVPYVKIPVLMVNGRDDFQFLVETNQMPMFRLLGAPEKNKRHVLYESGHAGTTQQYIKETLDWFDRYLGPVSR